MFKEENLIVRREIFRLIADRCNLLNARNLPVITEIVNQAVNSMCIQIRAMDKDMRIFCADLMCTLDFIPESTVV